MLASLAFTLASAVLATAQGTTGGLTINTPTSVVQCQPVALSWSGGTAPYFVSIIPGGQAGAAAIESFPSQSGTSYTWTADITPGTSITFQLKDSTGAINYSQQVTVQQGTSSSCGSSGGSGSAAAGGSSSAAAGGATSAAATTSAAAATSASAKPASSASSAAGGGASKASSAGGAATSGAASVASAAASSVSSSTSDANKIGAGLFGVVAGAFFAIFA